MAVVLEPPDFADERDWRSLPGATVLRPDRWALRITRGSYFQSVWANALVVVAGTVPVGAVGRVLAPAEIPAGIGPKTDPRAVLRPGGTGLYARSLEAARTRAWEDLFDVDGADGGGRWEAAPLAWLDRNGEVVAPATVRRLLEEAPKPSTVARAEGLALVLRLKSAYGRIAHVAVRLPFLVQGPGLWLQRAGGEVRWERAQVWRVRPTTANALRGLPPCDVPLEGTTFEFRYLAETRPGRMGRTIGRVLLTPVTALLDVLFATSLDALRWSLEHGRRRPAPRRGPGGR